MRRLLLPLLLLLALLAPAPARAAGEARHARAIGEWVAARAWGPLPCGKPRYVIRDRPPAWAPEASAWIDGPCLIAFHGRWLEIHVYENPDRYRAVVLICTVIVHEFGHLAGRGHEDDPTNVMHSPVPNGWRPCEVVTGWLIPPTIK